jgi:hypothetical protein
VFREFGWLYSRTYGWCSFQFEIDSCDSREPKCQLYSYQDDRVRGCYDELFFDYEEWQFIRENQVDVNPSTQVIFDFFDNYHAEDHVSCAEKCY